MIVNKQNSRGLKSLDNSLLIKKINRQSRMKDKNTYKRANSSPYSQKPIKAKNFYNTIDHESRVGSRKLYPPIKVPILERKAIKMSESSCEKSYDSQIQKESMSDRLLAERAKVFVSRLRKEKKYRQGRFLLKKKEQEHRHQSHLLKRLQQQKYKLAVNKQYKVTKAIQSILKHEERINSRLSINLQKIKELDKRYRTEDTGLKTEEEQLSLSLSRRKMDEQTEKVLSLQRKIKGLSAKIRQMCQQ